MKQMVTQFDDDFKKSSKQEDDLEKGWKEYESMQS